MVLESDVVAEHATKGINLNVRRHTEVIAPYHGDGTCCDLCEQSIEVCTYL